jgi:hypothetical protein
MESVSLERNMLIINGLKVTPKLHLELNCLSWALSKIYLHTNSSTRVNVPFWLNSINVVAQLVSNGFKRVFIQ